MNELVDIDMQKFEKDNNVKLNYILYSLFGKNDAANKKSVDKLIEKSAEKSFDRSKSKSVSALKFVKRRVSDIHINVGLGKRIDPLEDNDKKVARIKWEKVNIKKDHLMKFTQKDNIHRVL